MLYGGLFVQWLGVTRRERPPRCFVAIFKLFGVFVACDMNPS